MAATIRQIVNDAQVIVGEVTGAGVQVFSEDRMKADAIRAFNTLFKKYHWQQYRQWFTGTLDGVLGIVTTDLFTQVLDFEDFIGVYYNQNVRPMPIKPVDLNPFSFTQSGGAPRYWDSLPATNVNYPKRKLQFYPQASVGTVRVLAMVYPRNPLFEQNWDWNDVMYLDGDMLAYATAFMTLSGDDLNAAAAGVAKGMLDDKFDTVMKAIAKHPIPITNASDIPMYYQEYPAG